MKGSEHSLTCGDDAAQAAAYRRVDPEFARWAAGCGVIGHSDLTQLRVREMATRLLSEDEFKALNGEADPAAIIACDVGHDVGHGGRLSRRA